MPVKTNKYQTVGKYCKFDIFSDDVIGLEGINDLQNESLMVTEQDEDYATDGKILKNTKRMCIKDLLETFKEL
jgi:hypothetical protein